VSSAAPTAPPGFDLGPDPRRRRREAVIKGLFLAAALTSIAISVAIVASLISEALAFLGTVSFAELWTSGWFPRRGLFDLKTLVVGTLLVTAIAMLVAVPIGVGAAIYLSEYANPRLRRLLKPILEILAGVPSVVIGFFALTVISPYFVQVLFDRTQQFNLLAAGIGVGVLTIPLVASVSEDALRSVPRELREASYGLGARKRTTVTTVVVPAAISGLVAAFIIGTSRAIGETLVVSIAAGVGSNVLFTVNPLDSGSTMTGAIAALATGTDAVRGASNAFPSLFLVGLLLFGFTLLLNLLADRVVVRLRTKY